MRIKLTLIFLFAILCSVAGCETSGNAPEATKANANGPVTAASPATAGAATTLTAVDGALLVAAAKGDSGAVKAQLDKQANVNAKDQRDSTPLMEAVWAGHRDIVEILIEKGADVNARKGDGSTVLSIARAKKNQEIIDLLQKAGAR